MRHKQLLPITIYCLALGMAAAAVASAESPTECSLKTAMSSAEFEAAGLKKLTSEELEKLDRWLNCEPGAKHKTTEPAQQAQFVASTTAAATQTRTSNTVEQVSYPLTSVIIGSFHGWSGDTRFHLENGQTWAQRDNSRYSYSGTDLNVSINKNFMGYYWLTHLATGKKIPVKRID